MKLTPEQFVYWLQGFNELTEGAMPSEKQWQAIVAHLNAVFEQTIPHPIRVSFPGPPNVTPLPYTPIPVATC